MASKTHIFPGLNEITKFQYRLRGWGTSVTAENLGEYAFRERGAAVP
jgi:hypothetical protein